MNIIRLSLFVSALALLGGCVGLPLAPGHYAGSLGYYGPEPIFYTPPPVYFGPRIHIRPPTGGRDHGGKRDSARGPGRGPDRDSARGPGRGPDRGPGRGPGRR